MYEYQAEHKHAEIKNIFSAYNFNENIQKEYGYLKIKSDG